jgi:hypothetical protein
LSGRHGHKRNRKKPQKGPSPSAIHDNQAATQVDETKPKDSFKKSDEKGQEANTQMEIFRKPDPFDLALWGLVLTAIIAAIYFFQLGTMQDQLAEARKATEIQQRPWLSVDIMPVKGIQFFNDRAIAHLKLSIKNVGHSIAKSVHVTAMMYAMQPQYPAWPEAAQQQHNLCDHPTFHDLEADIFPSDQPTIREINVGPDPSNMAPQIVSVVDGKMSRRFVNFYFVGCVSYHASFGTELRQTRFAYDVYGPVPSPKGGGEGILKLSDGTPLLSGFEVGVNVDSDGVGMRQEIFGLNDAN